MTRRIRIRYRAFSIAVVWALSGCTAVTLREAQDHFNKAAQMELRALDASLLGDDPTAHPGMALAAANEYRLANATASALIDKKSSDLRQDKLLGMTYVLKAMALWRIADLEGNPLASGEQLSDKEPAATANSRQELLAVLREIETQSAKPVGERITLGTRDRVLHKALYGFYDHDGGRAAGSYSQARTWFQSALKRLKESVQKGVPEFHPVRIYIGSAQLRTFATWRAARFKERKRCGASSTSSNCSAGEKKNLRDDDEATRKGPEEVVCGLKPFWDKNETRKEQLKKLLVPIGLPSVFGNCP